MRTITELFQRTTVKDPDYEVIFNLLGETPETEEDALLAQEYLVERALESDNDATRNTALVALASKASRTPLGATRPLPSGPLLSYGPWTVTRDGDPAATALYNRHYSAKPNRTNKRIVGPGQRLMLVTPEQDALFIWRISQHRADLQWGAECAVFRNESTHLSSDLIRWAETLACYQWPPIVRFFTYVNATKIRSSNPGYTFQCAGWRRTEHVSKKQHLILLEKIIVPDILLLTPYLDQ